MNKRSIRRAFYFVFASLGTLLVVGVFLSIIDKTDKRIIFTTFKDLLTLVLGVAAAWLGYCVQRRSAYQQQLRILWSRLVEAISCTTQYTHLTNPTEDQYRLTLAKLSIAIDEVRGVFCNIGETDAATGFYPFEPLKDIHGLVVKMGYADGFCAQDAALFRSKIFALWKDARKEILKEFDREEPTFPHSHWVDLNKGRVYDTHDIPKTPT